MEDDESDFYKFDCNYSKENDFIDINDDKKENIILKKEFPIDFEIEKLINLYQNHADIVDILVLLEDLGNNMTDSTVIFTNNENKRQLFLILCEMLNSEEQNFKENKANYMSIWFLTKLFKYCFESFMKETYNESLLTLLIDLYKNENDLQIIIYIIALFEEIVIHFDEITPILIDNIIDEKLINIMQAKDDVSMQEIQNQICSFFITISQTSFDINDNESFLLLILDILYNNYDNISLFALEELTTCLNLLSDKYDEWSQILISKSFHEKLWEILDEKSVFTYPLLDTIMILLYYDPDSITIHEDIILKFLYLPIKTVLDKNVNPQRLILRLLKKIAIYKPSHPIFFRLEVIDKLIEFCTQSIFLFRTKAFSVICETLHFLDTSQKLLYIERDIIPKILEFIDTNLSNTMLLKLLFALQELLSVNDEYPDVLSQFYDNEGPTILLDLLDNEDINEESKNIIEYLQTQYFPPS